MARRNVFEVLDTLTASIDELRAILEPLRTLAIPTAPTREARPAAPSTRAPSRSRARSGGGSDARRLAGRYGALMRYLSPADRAEVKRLREEASIEKAVEVGERLLRRS